MKNSFIISTLVLGLALSASAQHRQKNTLAPQYIGNRAPLYQKPYIALPLGAITPEGWLRHMLVQQKNGATGHLDELYPLVMNERNGWLGGNGDQWERGPYWIDGLLPLAYILDDKELIAKTKPWVEWAIASQQPTTLTELERIPGVGERKLSSYGEEFIEAVAEWQSENDN